MSFLTVFSMQHSKANSDDKRLFPGLSNIYVAWDKDKNITRDLFGTTRYPESILIGPDGRITQKIVGVLTEENIATIKKTIGK